MIGNTKAKSTLQNMNDPQLQKVVQSVKSGQYSNPDLVLIGEGELSRMKVLCNFHL